MADVRAVAVVVLILLSAVAVGAVAGYRMILQDEWAASAEPVTANVTIEFPDGTWHNATVTVPGVAGHAYGTLEAAVEDNFTLLARHTSFGAYVVAIGPHQAKGACGWLYSVGGRDEAYQPDLPADQVYLEDDAHVFWYWGCIPGA